MGLNDVGNPPEGESCTGKVPNKKTTKWKAFVTGWIAFVQNSHVEFLTPMLDGLFKEIIKVKGIRSVGP